MKILNFDIHSFGEKPKSILNKIADIIDVASSETLKEKPDSEVVAVITRIGTCLNASLLETMPSLRTIATVTTGLDHIDQDYCRKKQIEILSLRGETAFLEEIHATPELTWSLLLSLIRNLPSACEAAKKGLWERTPFFGHELYGKKIAIIGVGRVGKIVGRYADAFGMEVIGVNDCPLPTLDYPLKPLPLEEALKNADVVSLHLPMNQSTHHFIQQEHFEIMKEDAVFINTARGALVNESALLNALMEKKIAGAALDVLEHETSHEGIRFDHPLLQFASKNNNLIITPHLAGMTFESMEKTAIFMAKKLQKYLEKNGHH